MRDGKRKNFNCWQSLFEGVSRATVQNQYDKLTANYAEEHRYYHTLSHIEDCLSKFDRVKGRCHNPGAVEIAIWCHDVIYDPCSGDNEKKSAEWTAEFLHSINFDSATIELVADLIIATANHDSDKADSCLLNDIDLSILGSDSQCYTAYRDAIRKEYIHVPDDLYALGRTKVLESFLKMDKIFQTEVFSNFEEPARQNMTEEMEFLSH